MPNKTSEGKDFWDRLSSLSTFFSTVVIGGLGIWFTHDYNERQGKRDDQAKANQTRVLEMETVEKFIPHLKSTDENEKKVALLALSTLASAQLATQLVKLYPSRGAQEAGDAIMASANPATQTALPPQVVSTAAPAAGANPGKAGWVYLGHYDSATSAWLTRYFEFDDKLLPERLSNSTLTVTERNGAVNVRSGMPTPAGDFQEVRDVLSPKSQVTVTEVHEWDTSGYMWAKVTYGT
jgi:hypothetical protein